MKENDSINIAVESEIKTTAEEIFAQFGLTKNEAIELFYRQVAQTRNIPFIERNFNQETIEAVKEVTDKDNLASYGSFAKLRQDLEV
jgi:addiction module RelB/DinJ family antitoxin